MLLKKIWGLVFIIRIHGIEPPKYSWFTNILFLFVTYLKLFLKQPSNVLVSHLRPINIRTPFSPLIDLDIEQLNLAQCPESTKLLTRLDMILWSLLQRKSSQSKNTQWDLLSCSDESEVWHLSAALMTWLELQLIILLTWICLHFSFLIKCY